MNGLTQKQAEKLLTEYGSNSIEENKGSGALRIFVGQFRDVMVMILLAATIVSVFLGEIYDAVTIITIVLLNAVLGFVQEYRTEKTLEALASMTAPTAKVRRDGKLITIKAKELVPGDVIELSAGDRVPADCVILECTGLFADESMLNGESEAVLKTSGSPNDKDNSLNRSCIAYSGTMITKGNAECLVTATGKNAQVGKISSMISNAESSQTPLQKRLGELGKIVAFICMGVCLIVFAAGVLRGEPVFDMLMTGITIAIAAIPEGLPATVTIALALAVNRMLKVKALVNRLHSVETLGCTSVICSDKTGTITENKMTVKHIFTDMKLYDVSGTGYKRSGSITLDGSPVTKESSGTLRELLYCSVLCSSSKIYEKKPSQDNKKRQKYFFKKEEEWETVGDPTETALLIAAAKGGVTAGSITGMKKLSEIPFDSDTKQMSVKYRNTGGKEIVYSKGAPDILVRKCKYIRTENGIVPATAFLAKKITENTDMLSSKGLRVLCLAYEEDGCGMIFLGLAAMSDPPREEAKKAIKECRSANIKTVMITGDHKETAAAVADEAGILCGKKAVTGKELDSITDEQLDNRLDEFAVFARVTPAHKLRLVRAYKRRGNIVTMTGDGVNDAPAIKEADVGVAMGITGTDVAKQAADVILLDDNFATIVKAVREGRGIYANIRKFVRYLLSCNIGEVIVMFLSIISGLPIVLLPTQLLLVNLVTDGLPAIALGMEPCEKDVMKNRPRGINESFFSGGLLFKIIIRGILIGFSTLGSFAAVLNMSGDLVQARSAALITLIMSQLIHVFECRSEKKGLFSISPFSNMKLLLAVILSAAALAAAIYLPAAQLIFATSALSGKLLWTAAGFSAAVPIISGLVSALYHKR